MEYKVIDLWGTGGPPEESLTLYTEPYVKKAPFYTPESKVLQQCKNSIDNFYEEGKWDDYKKITNPYEYIFLSWNRRTSRSVATRQPLSRSFFKMIELWKCIDITGSIKSLVERDGGLITTHSAEGPGGFIEACTVIAEQQGWVYKDATAITLRSEAKNVPGWRKANRFLETWPQIEIHDGADGTGNILVPANREAYIRKVLEKTPTGAHVYTADGGFDFSSDFNAQEDTVMPLLFAEVYLGLKVLAKGGILVIKCFDTTEQSTLDLIWVMSRAFCTWGVVKPCTSRAGNAERYLVGKGFLGGADDSTALLEKYMAQNDYERPIIAPPACGKFRDMIQKLYEIQCAIEHIEIEVIRDTLNLIKKAEHGLIKRLVRDNVIRSIQWCETHGEQVATFWLQDLDRNVIKECTDLVHILNPVQQPQYGRPSTTSTVSFEGFRSGTMPALTVVNNPFNRTK
jgi:hypothetical protein